MSRHRIKYSVLLKTESYYSFHICAAVRRSFPHPPLTLHPSHTLLMTLLNLNIRSCTFSLYFFSFHDKYYPSLTILVKRMISHLIVRILSYIIFYHSLRITSYLIHSPPSYFNPSHTYVLTTPDLYSRFPKLYVPVDFVRLNVSTSIAVQIIRFILFFWAHTCLLYSHQNLDYLILYLFTDYCLIIEITYYSRLLT